MIGKIFAKSARGLNRRIPSSGLRYRPKLDVLEDRTVLSPVSFHIVQNQSPLALSGTIGGMDIQQQGPGALTTTYFGDFETDIDMTNGLINFIGTGNDFCAAETGNWAPRADGSTGTAPAIYGFQVDVSGPLLGAIRDFHVRADTFGSALALYPNDDGTFGYASAQTLTINAGSGTYSHPDLGHGPIDLGRLNGPNQAGDGNLVDNGDGSFRITVPVSVSVSATIGGIDSTLNVDGQIVGTGRYSGSGPGAHSPSDISIVAFVSRTHSRGDAATGAQPQGLAPASTRGVAMATPQTLSQVHDARASDAGTQRVHDAIASDQFTALNLVFQEPFTAW